ALATCQQIAVELGLGAELDDLTAKAGAIGRAVKNDGLTSHDQAAFHGAVDGDLLGPSDHVAIHGPVDSDRPRTDVEVVVDRLIRFEDEVLGGANIGGLGGQKWPSQRRDKQDGK